MKHHLIDTVLRVFGTILSVPYYNFCALCNCMCMCVCVVSGVDDEAGDFTGLAMNAYWTQNEILRADFRELATGISDVCIRIKKIRKNIFVGSNFFGQQKNGTK